MLRTYGPTNFRLRTSRSGVTLTEVLISIGIMAVGLLGAAAMFPVGGYFMQKGEIADRGAAIAQAAFADLVARGALAPDNWRVWSGGQYRRMDDFMQAGLIASSDAPGILNQVEMNEATGFIYVIDPLGTAGGFRSGVSPLQLARAPAVGTGDGVDWDSGAGNRWDQFPEKWPVRRLCTKSMIMGDRVPSEPLAQSLYSSSDDLAIVINEEDDESLPRRQQMEGADTNGDSKLDVPFRRQSQGNFSWMAMVAPTQSEARQALALDPSAFYFDVSVIVFYKRPIGSIGTSEVLVKGVIQSTGTGGGEILLDSTGLPNAYEDFKQGQWVMVCGPHPSSTDAQPLFFSQWYRVLAIDEEKRDAGPITNTETQRLVGLRGPDWPWKAAGTPVCVGLFPGAVAVHTKTMRLESSGAYEL